MAPPAGCLLYPGLVCEECTPEFISFTLNGDLRSEMPPHFIGWPCTERVVLTMHQSQKGFWWPYPRADIRFINKHAKLLIVIRAYHISNHVTLNEANSTSAVVLKYFLELSSWLTNTTCFSPHKKKRLVNINTTALVSRSVWLLHSENGMVTWHHHVVH